MNKAETYTAFHNASIVAHGSLSEVILKVKKIIGSAENSSILIFSDGTGKIFDFNFQGTAKEVQKRLEVFVSKNEERTESGPGRPKLGVISREISLLPRHWEWLATQSAGASATIRNLVEDAMRKSSNKVSIKNHQEKAYRIMTALAGESIGYEEAIRALYKRDKDTFMRLIENWPKDLCTYLKRITKDIFRGEE